MYNIHGHIHTKDKFFQDNPYFYNVSCDSQNCMPVKAEDMIADIENEVKKCIELLDVEVYTDSQGTSGSRIEKQKEMTGLMAGDVMRFRKDWSTKEDRERNLQSN